jgi:hypothetical protein
MGDKEDMGDKGDKEDMGDTGDTGDTLSASPRHRVTASPFLRVFFS